MLTHKIVSCERYTEEIYEGQADEKLATARRFLAMGLSPEQVAKGSELTLDKVMRLMQ